MYLNVYLICYSRVPNPYKLQILLFLAWVVQISPLKEYSKENVDTMQNEIHAAEERGKSDLGWLQSRFSFSFADYYNPRRMGFGKLRVLNDDIIAPGKGFDTHQHANMEIITIVTAGKLEHKDSTGVKEVISKGDIQVMSAGKGMTHSEYNHSNHRKVELFQIWVETKTQNIIPRHDTRRYDLPKNKLLPVVSGKMEEDTLFINQDAKISLGKFKHSQQFDYKISDKNGAFILVIEGTVDVEGERLARRDGIAISDAKQIKLEVCGDSHIMVIEVPM